MATATTWAGYEVSRHNLFHVSPLALQCDPNLNISRGGEPIPIDQDLMDLADSMLQNGQCNPCTVVNVGKGEYSVAMGARRYEAARYLVTSGKAPDFKLKCVTTDGNPKDFIVRNLSENLHRLEPKPIHMARAVQTLMTEHKMGRQEVAGLLNRSGGWVDYHMGLLSLPASVQSAVDVGELPVTAAVELGKLEDEQAQEQALENMREQGDLSAEGAREQRRSHGQQVKRGLKPLKEFLKMKGQDGECGSEAALLLLDILDGKVTPDEASILWDKATVSFMNCIVPGEDESEAA